jgi:hypothetical protein
MQQSRSDGRLLDINFFDLRHHRSVVVLGALFVYKKIQKRKEAQEIRCPTENRRQPEETEFNAPPPPA